jgi:hypothetical protein
MFAPISRRTPGQTRYRGAWLGARSGRSSIVAAANAVGPLRRSPCRAAALRFLLHGERAGGAQEPEIWWSWWDSNHPIEGARPVRRPCLAGPAAGQTVDSGPSTPWRARRGTRSRIVSTPWRSEPFANTRGRWLDVSLKRVAPPPGGAVAHVFGTCGGKVPGQTAATFARRRRGGRPRWSSLRAGARRIAGMGPHTHVLGNPLNQARLRAPFFDVRDAGCAGRSAAMAPEAMNSA